MTTSGDRIVRVKIRETRHGNIASRSEVDAGPGLRGPTEAERKASRLHNKILDRIDESEYESGDVIADIHVPEEGEPWIDWNDDVVGAAGNDPHVAADGGPAAINAEGSHVVHANLYCGDAKIERLALDVGETFSSELPSDDKYHFEIVEVEER